MSFCDRNRNFQFDPYDSFFSKKTKVTTKDLQSLWIAKGIKKSSKHK